MPSFYVLDVGHGNCAVLIDRKGVVVIDAGPKARGKAILIEFLLSKNITTIDVLLLSHSDKDHIAGAINLLTSGVFTIKQVYVNSDSTKNSVIWDDLVYLLCNADKMGELYFEPSLTPHFNGKLDQGEVAIEVLAPNKYIAAKGPGSQDRQGRKLTSNSISAVIRLSYHGKPIALLPGDIDQVGLSNLLEENTDIRAWLTVYPHHGGQPGNRKIKAFAAQFCEAVKPEVVIFSIRDNDRHFPTKEVIETVQDTLSGVRLLSTRSSLALARIMEKTGSELHKNSVGHIHLDLESEPLQIKHGFPC
jgi:beta-lactamase superfamily II metal-dependent hydrolase